jgi:hypothetical protein
VNDCHFGYITISLKETVLIPRTVWYLQNLNPEQHWYIYMHAFDQQFSKVKKLVLTVWPLGPAIFSKTIRPVWELACGSKESKKGGSKNLP